jgi:hypothetical protein
MHMVFGQAAQFCRHVFGCHLQSIIQAFAADQLAHSAAAGHRIRAAMGNLSDIGNLLILNGQLDFNGIPADAHSGGLSFCFWYGPHVQGLIGMLKKTLIEQMGRMVMPSFRKLSLSIHH